MPKPLVVDRPHARRFLLDHLHLLRPRKLRGKQGILDFVRHVNCIQFDPINVVGQNPHLVLQSRVRSYRPSLLTSLLYEDRKLIDGFDKQMSIYPIEDWPAFAYYRRLMARRYMEGERTAPAARLVRAVRKEIEARGPLSSLELEDDSRMDWWLTESVRAARIAMDILFYGGETVVHHRIGTRRYFDLSRRVLPPMLRKSAKSHTSEDEYIDWHVLRRAGGLGLVGPKVSAGYGGIHGWQGGRIRAAIGRLEERGELVRIQIEGLERQKFHIRMRDLESLEDSARSARSDAHAAFIAPLDNLMWDRGLVELLFDFRYTWEVYLPAGKRRHGYYVLPVLYGDTFVARMDPELDRGRKVLCIKGWWWEPGVTPNNDSMIASLAECLCEFARYLGAVRIQADRPGKGPLGKLVAKANRALRG